MEGDRFRHTAQLRRWRPDEWILPSDPDVPILGGVAIKS